MNVARSSLKLFFSRGVSSAAVFIGITYFARNISSPELGSFFLFQALAFLLSIISGFGLRKGVEKRISGRGDPNVVLSSGLLLKIFFMLLISIVILMADDMVNNFLGINGAIFLVMVVLLHDFHKLVTHTLYGEMRVGDTAILELLWKVIWIGSSVFFYQFGLGIFSLIYGLIIGFATSITWGVFSISTQLAKPTLKEGRAIFKFARFDLISELGNYSYNWIDVLILGYFVTQSFVGAYELAWRVALFMVILSHSIALSLFPKISNLESSMSLSRVEVLVPRALFGSLSLVIPAFFGTIILSSEIMSLLFGNYYLIASLPLSILMFAQVIYAINIIVQFSLRATNNPLSSAKITLLGVVLNICFNIILIRSFGILGAAIGTCLSLGLTTMLNWRVLNRYVNIVLPGFELSWCVLSSIIMSVFVYFIKTRYIIHDVFELIATVILGFVIYTMLMVSSPTIRKLIIKETRGLVE